MMRDQRRRDLMTRSQRAVRWLQPGLVVKRWLLTSGLGLLMALLGAAVWADLKPIYWILETLSWLLSTITTCLLYTSPSPRDRQKSRMPSSA